MTKLKSFEIATYLNKYLLKTELSSIIILILSFSSFGQQIKKYSGSYLSGKANYDYYDDENGERVLQGDYSYTYEDWDNTFPYRRITGTYYNGKKNGKWTQTIASSDKEAFEVTVSTYEMDILNGTFNFEKYFLDKSNKKIINSKNNYVYKNGQIIAFSLTDLYPFELKISGYLSMDGYADSVWEVTGKIEYLNEGDDWLGATHNLLVKMKYQNNCLVEYSEFDRELGKYRVKTNNILSDHQNDTSFYKLIYTDYKTYISCFNKYGPECHEQDEIRKVIAYHLPVNYSVKKATYKISSNGQAIINEINKTYSDLSAEYNRYNMHKKEISVLNNDKYISPINEKELDTYYSNQETALKALELIKNYSKIFSFIVDSDTEPIKGLREAADKNDGLAKFLLNNNLEGLDFFNNCDVFIKSQTQTLRNNLDLLKNTSNKLLEKRKEFERLNSARTQIRELENKYRINQAIPLSKNDLKTNLNGYFVINTYLFAYIYKMDEELSQLSDSISLDSHPEKKLELCKKRDSYQMARKRLLEKNETFTKSVFTLKVRPSVKNATINWEIESLELTDKKLRNVFKSFITPMLESLKLSNEPNECNDKMNQIIFVVEKCQQKINDKDDDFFKSVRKMDSKEEIYEFCKLN